MPYIFPIFCFGVVITGVVVLGLREASFLTDQLASRAKAAVSDKTLPEGDPR